MINVYAGDSMTDGGTGGAQTVIGRGALYYPYVLAALRGEPDVTNLGWGGHGVADLADNIFGHLPVAGERYFLFLGNVDQTYRSATTANLALFNAVLSADLAWWGTSKLKATDAGWTYTGAWSPLTPWSPMGNFTTAQNASAQASFSGDVCEFAYFIQDGNSASFSVAVDGVVKATLTGAPPPGSAILTSNPNTTRSYAPSLFRIAGCGPGTHTATFTKTDAGSAPVAILWLRQAANGFPLYLLTLPNCGTPSVQANVTAYNGAIAAVVTAAVAAGLSVTLIDAGTHIVPATDVVPNDIHLVNQGHAKYAAVINTVLGP